MHRDNIKQIMALTGLKTLAKVGHDDTEINLWL